VTAAKARRDRHQSACSSLAPRCRAVGTCCYARCMPPLLRGAPQVVRGQRASHDACLCSLSCLQVADFNLSRWLGEATSSRDEVTNPRWLAPEVLQVSLGGW